MKKLFVRMGQNLLDKLFGNFNWYNNFWERRYIKQVTKVASKYFDSVSSEIDKIIGPIFHLI